MNSERIYRAPRRTERFRARLTEALSDVAWFAVIALMWCMAGAVVAGAGVYKHSWYLIALGAVLELVAANLTFLSMLDDR